MAYKVTEEEIRKISKSKNPKLWADLFNSLMPKYGIETEIQVKMFLAQTAHESLGFTVLEENLNYSKTQLNKVFGKYFKNSGRDAALYARKPELIANIVYADRMGNGDTDSGDGWKYRGRGLIQLTGKNNHTAFAKHVKMPVSESLEYLVTPAGAAESACWFWKENDLNKFADKGDFRGLTKRINGGLNGIKHREELYAHLKPQDSSTSASPSLSLQRSITIGDRGEDVKAVQKALGIVADGIYGPNTHRAIKKFQAKHGLVVDGIVGPITWGKMGNDK